LSKQQSPIIHGTVIINATGISSPVDVSEATRVFVGCNSLAGQVTNVEGSFDDVTWANLHIATSITTLQMVGGIGPQIFGVEESVPMLRFNVASIVASNTLTLPVYGV